MMVAGFNVEEQFLGVLTVRRQPRNSDKTRIRVYIWGRTIRTHSRYGTLVQLH
jgi:hypothetical protein